MGTKAVLTTRRQGGFFSGGWDLGSWQKYRNREPTVKNWYINTGTFVVRKIHCSDQVRI